LQAERRLLDAKPFGGAGETEPFCHGNEIAEMTQFHLR
jgi:hypothetical protein